MAKKSATGNCASRSSMSAHLPRMEINGKERSSGTLSTMNRSQGTLRGSQATLNKVSNDGSQLNLSKPGSGMTVDNVSLPSISPNKMDSPKPTPSVHTTATVTENRAVSPDINMEAIGASLISLRTEEVEVSKCPICAKELNSPKCLPCLHTFCEACVSRHVGTTLAQGKTVQIRCPVCSTPVSTARAITDPMEFSKSLPTNHFISSLMALSLIHIWRCRRYAVCRSRWSPYH